MCLFPNTNITLCLTSEPRSPTPPTPFPRFPFQDAELLEMIERADNDQDGEINFEEFYAIMTKKTFS